MCFEFGSMLSHQLINLTSAVFMHYWILRVDMEKCFLRNVRSLRNVHKVP